MKRQGDACFQHRGGRRSTGRSRSHGLGYGPSIRDWAEYASERDETRSERRAEKRAERVRRTEKRQAYERLLASTAAYCAQNVVTGGGLGTVPERACEYVSDATWDRVTRGWFGWRLSWRLGRWRCTALAMLARAILEGDQKLHEGLLEPLKRLLEFLEWPFAAKAFALELARGLESLALLPVDQKLKATARGLQLTGIFVCAVQGSNLERCPCLRDFVAVEVTQLGEEFLNRFISAGANDWADLGRLPAPRAGT